jgi:alpha-tubulin suppressor-like RCC1 family protein
MSIKTVSQSQLGQDTAKNSQIVTTAVRLVNSGASTGPSISSIIVTDSGYNTLDDTAAATSNSYIRILGTGFTSTANVFLNGTMVPKANVTFTNSTELRVVLPVSNTGNYAVGVFNSNSAGALYSSSFVISTMPQWLTGATLANQQTDTAFSVSLSATSDSNITYSNTTALPAGTTLAANGLFSGTISTGIETTYSFDVKATDIENQDSSKTFSVTVTVGPGPGAMYTWGENNNANGILGLNDTVDRSSPTQVGSSTNWQLVSVGTYETSAIKTDGTLWYWGRNYFGAAGLNDSNTAKLAPTQIGTNTNWQLSSIGTYAHLAIKTNGTLWAWGSNQRGMMGNNTTDIATGASSPVQIGTNTNWSLVEHQGYSVIALKTNGTLWSWGNNTYGELGLGDTNRRSSPTQIGTGTNWSLIRNGQYQNAAIKTDGTLWTWGRNNLGQLGHNNTTDRNSPTQVGTNTNWASIGGIDGNLTIAIKTDGTLWTWGGNWAGQLGQNDTIYRSSPTQVGSATNWKISNSARVGPALAIKTDGTLWTWGYNNRGQLGINNIDNLSSPVQVGSKTTWQTIKSGFFTAAAISTT